MLGKPKELRKALAGKPHTLTKADVLSLLKGKYSEALYTVYCVFNMTVIIFSIVIEVIIVPVVNFITYMFLFLYHFQKSSVFI